MEALTLDQLDAASATYDEAVARTPDIDAFCSSSDWVIPAARGLMPPHLLVEEPFIHRGPAGFAAFTRNFLPQRGVAILQPLEAMWALGCPLVGPDPKALVAAFDEVLRGAAPAWNVLVVTGVLRDGALARALISRLRAYCDGFEGETTVRCIVDLTEGAERWLERRSPNFRRSLRRAERDAAVAGVTFERCDPASTDAATLYERLLAIEDRSWKTSEGGGLAVPEMRAFYEVMVPRLARRGALRLRFARIGGQDAGYILGGVFRGHDGPTYRGLQFSFDDALAHLSLGNLAQWEEIRALATEGVALYDLGTDREYKRRWCDRIFETSALIFRRAR